MAWLLAFLFTQAVEVPIYMWGLRARAPEAFGATALTHPIVWFVIPDAWDWFYRTALISMHWHATTRYIIMIVIAETFAVVAEALYFRFLGLEKPWRWAFIANMSSVALGFTSRALFGIP